MAQGALEFKNIRAENNKISTIVWKLQYYIEVAVKQDKLCSQQQEVQKRANKLYELICQHNEHTQVQDQDEKSHTATRRPRTRTQTVHLPVAHLLHESSKRTRTQSASPRRDQPTGMLPKSVYKNSPGSPRKNIRLCEPSIQYDLVRNNLEFKDREQLEVAEIELQELTTDMDILKRTVEDQKKMIQEIRKRTDDEIKAAKNTIKRYQEEANRFKTECEDANAKYSQTQMEKEKILCMLQKQKSITEDETNNNKRIIDKLQSLLKEMQAENCNMKEKLTATEEQTKMSIRLRKYVQKAEDFTKENSILTQCIEKLKKYIKKLEDEKQHLCLDVERIDKEKETMELKYQREYAGLLAEFNIYKAEMNDQFAQCGDRSKISAMRYRAERNEAQYELKRLNDELQKIGDQGQNVNHLAQDRLGNMPYINDRLEAADIEFQELTTERDILKRTVEDQKKLIQEIEKRTDEKMNDAKNAIKQYQEESNRYKTACEETNAKLLHTKMEKEEILSMLQKQKSISEAETNNNKKIINNLQSMLKEMEADNSNMKNYVKKVAKNLEKTKLSNSRENEICKHEQEENRYRNERDQANQKVKSLTERLKEQHISREQLEKNIKYLQGLLPHVDNQRNGERLSLNYQKEQLGKMNEDLVAMTRKLHFLEEQLKDAKESKNQMHTANEDLKQELQKTLTLLHESNTRYNVENTRYRDTISTIEKEMNIEVTKLQSLVNELRSELQNVRSHDEQEKNSIKHELSKLREHNLQLNNDNHSLNDQKLELQKRLQQVESMVENQQTLIEENENLKKALTAANMDRTHLEERCNTETEVRISRDNVSTELRNTNDKLQKERNAALIELQRRTSEKNQLAQKLVTEINAAEAEHDQLKKEKDDLINLFKEKSNRDKDKISKLEQEYETLNARLKHEKEMRFTNDDTYNSKLIEENDRLRSERNLSRIELHKISKEKDHMSHELKEVVTAAKSDYDTLKREKNKIILDFEEKSERDNEKIRVLQEENETLRARNTETETRSHKDDANKKLREENNSLRTELYKLTNAKEEKLHELKREVAAAKLESEKLNKEKDNLTIDFEKQSKTDKEKISKLRQECEELIAKYEKETKTLLHIEKENDRLKSEIDLSKTELLQITMEKEEILHKLKQEVKAAKVEQEKCNKLEREIEDLNIRYKNEKETTSHKDDSYNNIREENNRLRDERDLVRAKVRELNNEKEEMSNKLKQEVTAAKSESDNLKKENENLMTGFKEKSKSDEQTIIKLRQECEDLRAKYKKEKDTASHKDDSYNNLREENNRLRNERDLARAKVMELNNDKEEMSNKLKQEVTAAKSESDNLKKEKENLMTGFKEKSKSDEQTISKLRQECEDLRAKYKKEKDTASHKDDSYNNIREENNRLRNERDLARAKVMELNNEKEEMSNKHKQEVTATKSESDNLKKEKENLMTGFKEKSSIDEQTISKLRQECEDLRAKYKKEKDTASHKDDSYNNIREENNRLRNERDLARAKVMELNNEKEEMSNKLKQEVTATKSESDNLKKEKENLMTGFKEKSKSDEQTISKLRQECEDLRAKFSSEAKMHQHNAYELMQLRNDIKICKNEKAHLEIALKDQTEENVELENKLRDEYERSMDKMKKEKQELQDKCRIKDDLLQKADKENRQLKINNDQLKSDIIGHHQEIETLNTRIEILREEKLELETRTRSRSPQVTSEPKQCQNCWKYKNDISELKKEVNSLRDRLSEAAGNKLRDNNPNIADLGDVNRPTSLAERFSTLYTDEYTDALEVIENNMTEAECAGKLLQWLKSCYDCCEQLAKEQRDLLTERSIGFMTDYLGQGEKFVISARCLIHVKEFQKKIAVDSLCAVGKICHVKSLNEETLSNNNQVTKYIKKCSELCWMMQISDPPLCLKFDVKRGESLDRNSYNVFTKSGSKVDFLVWPVLYLHKTGPLLGKGVAQGM